mgnify:CR=1 FL=1
MVVADPFRVVRDVDKRLDDERRTREEVYFVLEGKRIRVPKRPLMMGREGKNLEEEKREGYGILSQYENIRVFYHFKERRRFLYKAANRSEAERILEGVLEEMRAYRRWPALRRWQRSLERWKEKMLNYFISKSSNEKVKAHNVVVKLLKEVSFGMRDPDLYAKKITLEPAP